MPVRLTVDTWDPGFGASVDLADLPDTEDVVISDVEGKWEVVRPVHVELEGLTCAFVDGVRRVDLRLFAENDSRTPAPALAGSWAVGSAWSGKPPRIDGVEVGRDVVYGGGLEEGDLDITVGHFLLKYKACSTPGREAEDTLGELQKHMREAEGRLARFIHESGAADVLVVDGPLTYFSANGAVIGYIKRQSRNYLSAQQGQIFRALGVGERTPIFQIGAPGRQRYTWYVRVATGRVMDGYMTGIVRNEVSTEMGLENAVALANLAARLFPTFASQNGSDPRAPQNLYPVGQLEKRLKHMLGSPELIRRGIETTLFRSMPRV